MYAVLILDENCNPEVDNDVYRENCTLLKKINNLKSHILNNTTEQKITDLFAGTSFGKPRFNNDINITDEFTSDSSNSNIDNFITYEKKGDYLMRTQENIYDTNFFRFTENAEKSIYVKKNDIST